MKAKRVAPEAIQALKEALANIYWYKGDLRSFLTASIQDAAVLAPIDWAHTSTRSPALSLIVWLLLQTINRPFSGSWRTCLGLTTLITSPASKMPTPR